jgi:hypothetical protein
MPPSIVMVGLGPTIHEFLRATSFGTNELVDGRAKHDHDGLGGMRILEAAQPIARECSTWNTHYVTF